MSSPLEESHIIPRIRPKTALGAPKTGFVMRPLKLLARRVALDPFRRPLSTAIVTKAFADDLSFAYNHKGNSRSIWEGGPGEGKGEGLQRYARTWIALTGGKIKTTWDIDEIPELHDGDWLDIDEWLSGEGPGSVIVLRRLRNLFDTLRAHMISAGVSTPTAPDISFVNFIATTLAQDFQKRRNLYEVRVPLPRYGLIYIGNTIVPLHRNEVARQEYEKAAYDRKSGLIAEKGRKTIKNGLDPMEAARIVRAWAAEQHMTIVTKGQASAALAVVAKERNWDINYSNEPTIANLVVLQTTREVKSIPYTGQTADLRKAVCDCLVDIYGVSREEIAMLLEYAQGETQADIASRHHMSQPEVSDALLPIREEFLGYAFEDVWVKKLRDDGLTVEAYGKTSDEPDAFIMNENRQVLMVYSVKCYFDKKGVTTIGRDKLAKKELEFYQAGYPLRLVYFDFVSDKLFIVDVGEEDRFSFSK